MLTCLPGLPTFQRAVLHGVTGPIAVAGTKWDLEMPGFGAFADEDIAALMTYLRREWQHGASPVTAADVAKVRALTKDRAKAWTEAELKLPPGAAPPPQQVKADTKAKPKKKKITRVPGGKAG